MKVILIRHGDTDYSCCLKNKLFGSGLNLSPLSNVGIEQAAIVSADERLKNSQLIVTSPYTRAIQTAAIISRNTNIEIKVDYDLHEWVPDLKYLNKYGEEVIISKDFLKHEGFWPKGGFKNWEPINMLSKRITTAMNKYLSYDKIIVISHAVVIYHLTGIESVPNCCIIEMDYKEDYRPLGWFYKK